MKTSLRARIGKIRLPSSLMPSFSSLIKLSCVMECLKWHTLWEQVNTWMGSPRSQSPGLTIGPDTWTRFRIALFPCLERTKPVFRVLKLLIIELYWSLVDFLLIPNQCYPQTFPSRKISYNNMGSSHATWRTIWSFQWRCSELLPSHWRKSAWAGKDDPHSWAEQVNYNGITMYRMLAWSGLC